MIAMFSVAFTLFLTLATQVSAQATPPPANVTFNVTLGSPATGIKLFFYNQLLDFNFTGVIKPCETNCIEIKNTLAGTNGDAKQLCTNTTVKRLQECEQCMFTQLIAANKPMPDVRAGSTPVLGSYLASCEERKMTEEKEPNNGFAAATAFALALPDNWDGPTGIFIPTVGLVLGVGTGAFLGVSSILLLSNM
ncbi:hypothetical protein PQX77_004712 [Marasmius sp. AFHP31]|nr:hypothetical protein PQX77_004712 [Marasmius sp. AFHP31]